MIVPLVAFLGTIDKPVHDIRINLMMLIVVPPARESSVRTGGAITLHYLIDIFPYSTRARRFLLGDEFV
jgi:hypothetical protein